MPKFRTIQYAILMAFIFLSTVAHSGTRGMNVVTVIDPAGQEIAMYRESHALLIGVSDYEHWPDLPGVVKDVRLVQEGLEKKGFNVVRVDNPNQRQLENAYNDFILEYGQDVNNRLLFYFAGHGHTLKLSYGGEMGYIVPTDAPNPNKDEAGFRSQAVDMQMMEVFSKRIQAKHALFLFDSCFSGSIFSLSRAIPENISYKTSKPVRQFITAGSANETVPDESVFRQQFLEALEGEGDSDGDGYVTGVELGEFLQKNVINYSRGTQHPQYGKIRDPNLDDGDFVFSTPKRSGASRPSPLVVNGSAHSSKLESLEAQKKALEEARMALKAERKRLDEEKRIVKERRKIDVTPTQPSKIMSQTQASDGRQNVRNNTKDSRVERQQKYFEERQRKKEEHLQQRRENKLASERKQLERDRNRLELAFNRLQKDQARLKPGRGRDAREKRLSKRYQKLMDKSRTLEEKFEQLNQKEEAFYATPKEMEEARLVPLNPSIKGMGPDDMVYVSYGRFTMGTLKMQTRDSPRHTINIDSFYIDRYEVTQAAYEYVMKSNPSVHKGKDLPVENVTWHEAEAFCRTIGKRLPTEAEWEKAAWGGARPIKVVYRLKEEIGDYAWHGTNSSRQTHPVGQKKANGIGIYDILGNVAEWVSDWYGETYYKKSPKSNPSGPASGAAKVLRGGSWSYSPLDVRPSFRRHLVPRQKSSSVGFRCARHSNGQIMTGGG